MTRRAWTLAALLGMTACSSTATTSPTATRPASTSSSAAAVATTSNEQTTSVTTTTSSASSASATTASATTASATTASATTTSATTTAPVDCGAMTTGRHGVDVGGVSRSFEVVAPVHADRAPVIVLFHGYNSTAAEILATTGLDHLAPDHGIVVVAPQAIDSPTSWHIGDDSFGDTPFTDRVLAEVRASPCIDPTKIWLAGFSAGSAWTGVYGCAHTAGIAGLLMHSGLAPPICPAVSTPNVMIVHGTTDPVVPFAGGAQPVGAVAVQLASVPDSSAGWAARAGCGPSPTVAAAGAHVEIVTWSGCADGRTVSLQAVDGMGHTWAGGPGAPDVLNPGCVLVERLIEATDPVAACLS